MMRKRRMYRGWRYDNLSSTTESTNIRRNKPTLANKPTELTAAIHEQIDEQTVKDLEAARIENSPECQ